MDPMIEYLSNFNCIAVSDEVGRGPLAGPVVASTGLYLAELDPDQTFLSYLKQLGICDSKALTEKKRIKLLQTLELAPEALKQESLIYPKIEGKVFKCFPLTIQLVDEKTIDQINILQASLLAMSLGLEQTVSFAQSQVSWRPRPVLHLVDGNKLPPIDPRLKDIKVEQKAVVKGDQKIVAMGLVSIVAKQFRDLLMARLGQRYPGYGLEKHAGYPTKAHKEALKRLGPSPVHRLSFKGVLCQDQPNV
jgi:ribonuclease HII